MSRSLLVHLQHAEPIRFLGGNLDGGQRRPRAVLAVEAQHARVVHLVDVIAREHDELPRVFSMDGIEILVHRVGGAEIPVFADALLRTQDVDELAELVRDDAPAHAEVAAQRERLVLQGDEDLAEPRVDAVAQREIDDAVGAAEVHGRLGPFLRERIEPLAGASGQHHDEHIVQHVGILTASG